MDRLVSTRTTRFLKKDKYTTRIKGSIHQIGGRSHTKQGSSLKIKNVHGGRQDGKHDGDNNKNNGTHHMKTPYEWSSINTRRNICRRRRLILLPKYTTEEKEI